MRLRVYKLYYQRISAHFFIFIHISLLYWFGYGYCYVCGVFYLSLMAEFTASEKAQREKRKTITGQDLLWSITTLGFDNYVEPLKQHLHALRELEGEKGGLNKRAVNKLQNSEMFEFSGSSVESSNWFRY
mmetsp:Transcript_31786/g.82946  ORF Transcript_31786/g.82946 Transcript_31786/m.82946 type:complete len:130 (-) Transcript_31786:2570-2959(-)